MKRPEVDVQALAKLARLDVTPEELAQLEKEIPTILEFVQVIQEADVSGVEEARGLYNVMRPDKNSHESGIHTKKLLDAAPVREGNRIAVKQVISRNKK